MDPFSFATIAGGELVSSLLGSEAATGVTNAINTGMDMLTSTLSNTSINAPDTPSGVPQTSTPVSVAPTSGGGEVITQPPPSVAVPAVDTTVTTPAASSQSLGAATGGANAPQGVSFEDQSFANTLSPDLQADLTRKLTRVSTTTYNANSKPFEDLVTIHLPRDYYVSYPQAPPFATAMFLRYVKTKFIAEVQVNAPMGCAGIVVAYYLPPFVNEQYDHTTVFNSPHVIIDVARQSTAQFIIPYASTTPFVPVDSTDMGSVRLMPLTPFRSPTGTSATVTFVTYLAAVESVLSCPRPRRQIFSTVATNPEYVIPITPGSLNIANSQVSSHAQSLSLASEGFRIDHTTPGGQHPVRDFKWLAMRPGSRTDSWWFDWPATNIAESRLFAYNIDIGKSVGTLGMIANSFAYARGSLNITVMVASSVFNQGRLRIAAEPSGEDAFDNQSSMAVLFTILDISKSNTATLTVPYTSQSWLRRLTGSTWVRLSIFVNNPLTFNASSIDSVRVGIFLSFGNDVEVYVPHSNDMLYHAPPVPSQMADPFGPQLVTTDLTQGVSTPQPIVPDHPMFSVSHSSVEHLLGRFWQVTDVLMAQHTIELFPVPFPANTHAAIARSMAFWNGEPVFAVVNPNPFPIEVTHFWDENPVMVPSAMASRGSIIVPAQGNTMFSVPFYSATPVRSTDSNATLGSLVARTMNADHRGQVTLYAALRSANFFFPRPVPDWVIPGSTAALSSYRATLGMLTARGLNPDSAPRTAISRVMAAAASAAAQGPRNSHDLSFLLLLSGDVEENPGPCVIVHDPLNNEYMLEVGGMLLAITWPRDIDKLKLKASKGKSLCKWPRAEKCPRFSLRSPPLREWHIYGPTIYDWILADYFPCKPEITLCVHGLTTVEDPKVHVILDGFVLPVSRLARVDTIMMATWALAMAPKWFAGLPFSVPRAPPLLPPELRQTIAQRMADIAGSASSAIPQGPFDWISAWFDTYALKATLRNYAPVLIKAAIHLYAIHVAKDPVVTLLLGGMVMYDMSTCKAPPAIAILIEALACGTWDAFKAATTPLFLELPSVAWNRIHRAFTRLCARAQDFKKFTDVARSIAWWITAIGKLLQYIWFNWINPPTQDPDVQLAIADVLVNSNAFLAEASASPTKTQELAQKKKELITKLHYVLKTPGLPAEAHRLTQNAFNKILAVQTAPPPRPPLRVEPVGVWIAGEPGTGKSLLMSALSVDLAKHFNWGIYSHPTGSDYFDLYTNQEIHMIDDLGQSKEEKDLKILCQCISTVPFVVPIADLEGKGTYYNGKVVLATTNRLDFATYTLTTPGALQRRFPITVEVLKSPWTLDKASFDNRSFFRIQGSNKQPVRYDTLLQSIISLVEARESFAQSPSPVRAVADPAQEFLEGTSVDPDLEAVEEMSMEMDTPAHHDAWWRRMVGGVVAIDPVLPFLSDTQRDAHVQDLAARLFSSVSRRAIPEWVTLAFGAAGAFCAIRAFVSTVSTWLGSSGVAKEEKAPSQGPYNPTGTAVRVSARELARKADPQGPWSAPCHHLFKHTGYIQLECGTLYFCAVSSRTIIINTHMFRDLPENFTITTLLGEFKVNKSKLQLRSDGDITYAKCMQIPPHRTIQPVPEIAQGVQTMLLFSTPTGNYIQTVEKCASFPNVKFWHGTQTLTYAYNTSTRPGMCGGLLVCLHEGNWVPVGIHMAGTPSQGFSAGFVSPYLFESARAQGQIVTIKEVPRFTLGFCPKTKYMPSPVSLVVESDLAPAPLSAFDPRLEVKRDSNSLFLLEKFKKYDRDVKCRSPELLTAVADEYFTKLQSLFTRPARPVSLETAVFDTVTPMDHRASAGPKYPGIKRSELIDFQHRTVHDTLRADVHTLTQDLEQGRFEGVVFSSFFKDELRSWDKIRAGDTRVVECSSLDFTVAFRMQFLEVLIVLYGSDMVETGLGPGINVYTQLYPAFSQLYEKNLCLDFRKYDSRLSTEVMVQGARVLANLTTDPEVSMNFFWPIINSTHQVACYDVSVGGGMPSGCPITALYNSVCNILMMSYALLKCNPDVQFITFAYGDDNVVSVDQDISLDRFTSILREEFGMEPTAPDKTLNYSFVSPAEVTFLKRTLRVTPEYPLPVPVLPLDSMLSRICWCKGRREFVDQLRSFVTELALYGRETYTTVQAALLPAANLPPWDFAYRSAASVLGLEDMTHSPSFSFYCPLPPPVSTEDALSALTKMTQSLSFDEVVPQ
uniref:Genome polyprotein n=1 Tax=Eidolon dupreanum kunsagivirus TaxID=3044251 RepID=A0AA49FQE1_9PICO|nr:MAG: polyprotein [Eidolon dupreanum kunsagivirus]